MKLEARNNEIVLTEVYSGVIIETKEGKQLHICLRDYGFDLKLNDGKLHHISEEQDFGNVYYGRPTACGQEMNEDGTLYVESVEDKLWKYYECIHGEKRLKLSEKIQFIDNWMNMDGFAKHYPDVDKKFILDLIKKNGG